MPPERTIARLSLYRRLLNALIKKGKTHVYSHELATAASVSPAQVRRDIMVLGYTGTATKGYTAQDLVRCIGEALDSPEGEKVALVGLGHLGRAIANYFDGRRPKLQIVAGFDVDEQKVNRVYHGLRCYPVEHLEEVIRQESISMGILAAPADVAQELAERLQRAGVTGILNLAPIPLSLGSGIFVEDLDITTSLEKVAYFARSMDEQGKE